MAPFGLNIFVVEIWLSSCLKFIANKTISMKIFKASRWCTLVIVFVGFYSAAISQDTTRTKETVTEVLTNDEALWYMQPWVWVVGGIALLLLLIALFSGGRKKDKVTSRTDKVIITKTVRTETDMEE